MAADPRKIALDAIARIEADDAYANVLLPNMLAKANLSVRDKALVTELVYGSTRRKRALDHVVDRFLAKDPPAVARVALRLGAHQLIEMGTPPHAAVSATVAVTPKRFRPLVNAVLRKVARAHADGISYPSQAIALSYPDWLVTRLTKDLGEQPALDVLAAMNLPARQQRRHDDYFQDLSSQRVAALLPVEPDDLVLDMCAAPGGKSTYIASRGAAVVALDVRLARARLIGDNCRRLGYGEQLRPNGVATVVANGTVPPFLHHTFDGVLVDAPCSGLGVLRRRADARWRIKEKDIPKLSLLQQQLLTSAARLVVAGGTLIYSVCTLTRAETSEVINAVAGELSGLGYSQSSSDLWLPDSDQDGMFCSLWIRSKPVAEVAPVSSNHGKPSSTRP